MSVNKWVWLLTFLVLMGATFFIVYRFDLFVMNKRTANEVEVLGNVLNVGEIRVNYEDTNNIELFNKEELVARAMLEIASVQKDHNKDIEIEYVFLDKNMNETVVDSEIRSIQMKINFMDENKVVSSTIKRYAINELVE